MKVLILGGAGDVGRHAVDAAAKSDLIERVVIGERDVNGAEAVAAEHDGRVAVCRLDVAEDRSLDDALALCDVVLSCFGPYYRHGARVLSAAIRAGRHYLDVCDDWEPTLDMLALDGAARQAGVTAIIGIGASPGVTNLLAAAAHRTLDRVDALHTLWGIGDLRSPQMAEVDKSTRSALEHWLQQARGTIRVRREGAMVDVPSLAEQDVVFPGIGRVHCHALGHPEPVTLPLTYPEIRDSLNLMNFPAPIIAALRKTVARLDRGAIDMVTAVSELEVRLGEGPGIAALWGGARVWAAIIADQMRGVVYTPDLCALAIGQKDGRRASAGAWLDGYLPGGTGGATGVPLIAALEMLAMGEITRRGAFAPEAGIDPDRFVNRLERYATRFDTDGAEPFLRINVGLADGG
ncbi:MAG: saccharopine dehydrogenase NADP-binding domain-containing protein [Pseudomonadota bacterium]